MLTTRGRCWRCCSSVRGCSFRSGSSVSQSACRPGAASSISSGRHSFRSMRWPSRSSSSPSAIACRYWYRFAWDQGVPSMRSFASGRTPPDSKGGFLRRSSHSLPSSHSPSSSTGRFTSTTGVQKSGHGWQKHWLPPVSTTRLKSGCNERSRTTRRRDFCTSASGAFTSGAASRSPRSII